MGCYCVTGLHFILDVSTFVMCTNDTDFFFNVSHLNVDPIPPTRRLSLRSPARIFGLDENISKNL